MNQSLFLFPSKQPVLNQEFSISTIQSKDGQVLSQESFYWPRTESEREQWFWRTLHGGVQVKVDKHTAGSQGTVSTSNRH